MQSGAMMIESELIVADWSMDEHRLGRNVGGTECGFLNYRDSSLELPNSCKLVQQVVGGPQMRPTWH